MKKNEPQKPPKPEPPKTMSSEELGFALNAEYGKIIDAQANISAINAELRKRKEKIDAAGKQQSQSGN
jgi:hypothetical protein